MTVILEVTVILLTRLAKVSDRAMSTGIKLGRMGSDCPPMGRKLGSLGSEWTYMGTKLGSVGNKFTDSGIKYQQMGSSSPYQWRLLGSAMILLLKLQSKSA